MEWKYCKINISINKQKNSINIVQSADVFEGRVFH